MKYFLFRIIIEYIKLIASAYQIHMLCTWNNCARCILWLCIINNHVLYGNYIVSNMYICCIHIPCTLHMYTHTRMIISHLLDDCCWIFWPY